MQAAPSLENGPPTQLINAMSFVEEFWDKKLSWEADKFN